MEESGLQLLAKYGHGKLNLVTYGMEACFRKIDGYIDRIRKIIIHSFIHAGYFYNDSSSPLLLRGAPNYSNDTVLG